MTLDEMLTYENTPRIEGLISAIIKAYEFECDKGEGLFDYRKGYDFLGGRSIRDIVSEITDDGRDLEAFKNVIKAVTLNERTEPAAGFYQDLEARSPKGREWLREILDTAIEFFYSEKYLEQDDAVNERMLVYLIGLSGVDHLLSDGSAAKAFECASAMCLAAETGTASSRELRDCLETAFEAMTGMLANSENGRKLLLYDLSTVYAENYRFASEALAALTFKGVRNDETYKILRTLVKAENDPLKLFYLLDCVGLYGDPRAVTFLRTKVAALLGMAENDPEEGKRFQAAISKAIGVIESFGGNTEGF